MKIFISHANKDKKLIFEFQKTLVSCGITLLMAEHFLDLKHTISEKIQNMIDSCDIALVLLTKNGFDSHFVMQEIGYITKANKPMLHIVEVGLEKKISGFNFGKDYIKLNPANPAETISYVRFKLIKYMQRKRELAIMENHKRNIIAQQQYEAQRKAIISGLGLLAVIIIIIAIYSKNK